MSQRCSLSLIYGPTPIFFLTWINTELIYLLDILIVSSLHGYTVHSMRQVRLEIGMKHGVYLLRLLHG